MTNALSPTETERFFVRFYDAKLSRKGEGVRLRRFVRREDAEAFAVGKRLYGAPAVVEDATEKGWPW